MCPKFEEPFEGLGLRKPGLGGAKLKGFMFSQAFGMYYTTTTHYGRFMHAFPH